MGDKFNDFNLSLRMRDAITAIAESAVKRLYPPPRFGTVVSRNLVNRTVTLSYPEGGGNQTLPAFGAMPAQDGQTVRVVGPAGARYVDAVVDQRENFRSLSIGSGDGPALGGVINGYRAIYMRADNNDSLQMIAHTSSGRPYISFWNQKEDGTLARKGYIGYPNDPDGNNGDTSNIYVQSDLGNVVIENTSFNGNDVDIPGTLSAGTTTLGATTVGALTASSLNLTTALPVSEGGTGATTATVARSNLSAANVTHTHSGADITSGTVAFARLPTGTSSSQVAIGNHTHSIYVTNNAADTMSGKLTITVDGATALQLGNGTDGGFIYWNSSANDTMITSDATLTNYFRNGANSAFATWRAIISDASSQRYKANIVSARGVGRTGVLARVRSGIRPVVFDWDDPAVQENNGRSAGVLAEELHVEFPEITHLGADGTPEGVSPTGLAAIGIAATQELADLVDELSARVAALEAAQP